MTPASKPVAQRGALIRLSCVFNGLAAFGPVRESLMLQPLCEDPSTHGSHFGEEVAMPYVCLCASLIDRART